LSNVIIYAEEWATKLQERLAEPVKWKTICQVQYTNERVLHNPYLTEATVQSGTRGSAYTPQDITVTDDNVTIDQFKILPQIIDRADLAQTTFVTQMVLADKQGVLLNEAIESAVYADNANFTDFGDLGGGAVGLGASQITVSATNIDDMIRGIKREIRKAGGQGLLERNGGFMVWRPQDLEILESFMQANGFQSADRALNGTGALDATASTGIVYMGMTHYSSNLLAANHVFAGVNGLYHLGIVTDTYGQVVVTQDPVVGGGQISGVGVISRVDYKGKVWHNVKPVLFDVNVA
jgi:hypothetical protein